ncbi:MAG: AAA family ATPase, partial [Oscillospiraceae bacterium]|nr:AAA family ATPase [Oscillospiraceae bacterium]
MKLRTIYIKNFGKLKDFKLKLKPELNIICGNNESGKTTVMSFIKMMFYGTSCKSSDIGKNLRKKYAPWDGSPMSGYIEFEASGQEYRLEREFGNSNISDVITIWNLTT